VGLILNFSQKIKTVKDEKAFFPRPIMPFRIKMRLLCSEMIALSLTK
jgi:hypothetical protein